MFLEITILIAILLEYENYILVSSHTKTLGGTYQRFVKFKGLMSSLNLMSQKQSNSYTYNGETYVSKLTASEINKILDSMHDELY